MPMEMSVLAAEPGLPSLENLYFPSWPAWGVAGILACKQARAVPSPGGGSVPGSSSSCGITSVSSPGSAALVSNLEAEVWTTSPPAVLQKHHVQLDPSRQGKALWPHTSQMSEVCLGPWSPITWHEAAGPVTAGRGHLCLPCQTGCPGPGSSQGKPVTTGPQPHACRPTCIPPSAWLFKEECTNVSLWKQNLHCFSEMKAAKVPMWRACGQLSVPQRSMSLSTRLAGPRRIMAFQNRLLSWGAQICF